MKFSFSSQFIFVFCLGFFMISTGVFADETTQTNENSPSAGLSITVGDQTVILDSRQMSDWMAVQTRLDISARYTSEIENTRLCPTEQSFCDFALSQKTRASIRNHSSLIPHEAAIKSYIDKLDETVSKPATDAKFTVIDGKIVTFSLSQDGTALDKEASVSLIMSALTKKGTPTAMTSVNLPITALKPAHSSSDADKLGIAQLIGEGHTTFAGSTKNRIHNFTRAMEQFNGLMIAPQEEFSFVKFLGAVDGEHGYLPELVIKQNKTTPEFGGGICQVSSTVFRAAIYSGLKITARRNHAYPVSYYKPYGMDATIYIPNPDLRFVNNTPGHILMQASIEGPELIFRFYGTSDGRKTEVDGPHILEHNPDGSMKTIFTQKVTDAQGNVIINDDFRSNYASPSKYPHPGQEPIFSSKPTDWSQNQWDAYKKLHNL